jgi:hypothetical protein
MDYNWEDAILALDNCIKELYICRLRFEAARRNIQELKEWFEPVRPEKPSVSQSKRQRVKTGIPAGER